MTTDHDLDVRLSAAGGVRSDELPPLPAAFLAHLRDDRSGTGPVLRPHAVPSPTAAEPASVLAARQLVADAHARRQRPLLGRRRAVTVAAATAAAAAVVVGVTAVTGSGSSPAGTGPRGVDLLADYSTTPTAGSDEQKAGAQVACAAAMTHAVAAQDSTYADESPATITEVRDAWTLSIFDGRRNSALCLVHADATGGSVEGIDVRGAAAGPPAQGITTESVTRARLGDPQATEYTAVAGRAARDVDGVLRLGNGQTVVATVRNGWWAAWWPTDGRDDLSEFRTAYTTGPVAHPTDGGRIVTRITPGG